MIHLTLTGYQAGNPLCNVDKQESLSRGDKFYHAMYFNDWDNPNLCPDCKRIYDDAMEDDEEG